LNELLLEYDSLNWCDGQFFGNESFPPVYCDLIFLIGWQIKELTIKGLNKRIMIFDETV